MSKATRRAELLDDMDLAYMESEQNIEADDEYIRLVDEEVRGAFDEE